MLDTINSFGSLFDYWNQRRPEKEIITFLEYGERNERRMTYAALYESAMRVGAGLRARGIGKGDRVIIMLPTGKEFFSTIYGTFLIGAVPVPVYPPFSVSRIEHFIDTLSKIAVNCNGRLLVTFRQVKPVIGTLLERVPTLEDIVLDEDLPHNPSRFKVEPVQPEDLAMLQYTSGSTSYPKGVKLSYRNIFSNIQAVGEAVGFKPEEEIGCSWLPIYHDFGLIATAFYTLLWGYPLYIMSPLHFLAKPARWIQAISRYRCTLSPAPNFAYELCNRKISDADLKGVDLSSWKVAYNAAEPIRKSTLETFIERFGKYGFRRETMFPVYGMAEHTVGISFPALNGPKYMTVKAASLEPGRTVEFGSTNEDTMTDCISVGYPYKGHALRIINESGNFLPERTVGEIVVGGPSLSSGYFNRQEEFDKNLIRHPELEFPLFRSGDLGFMLDRELYITGRKKDLIIVRGRNFYPQDIEAVVEGCAQVRRGCTAAFSVNGTKGSESLVIVAESNAKDPKEKQKVVTEIQKQVTQSFGIMVDEIKLIPPRSIPKTSSGKIQRAKSKELYLNDGFQGETQMTLIRKGRLFFNSAYGYGRFYLRKLITTKSANPESYLDDRQIESMAADVSAELAATVVDIPNERRQVSIEQKTIRDNLNRALIDGWGKLSRLFWNAGIEGLENLPADGPFILHVEPARDVDILWTTSFLPKSIIQKTFTFGGRRLAQVFFNPLPSHNGNGARNGYRTKPNDKEALTNMVKSGLPVLRNGSILLPHPNSLSHGPSDSRIFRVGVSLLSVLSGAPIVPVIVQGGKDIFPSGSLLPRLFFKSNGNGNGKGHGGHLKVCIGRMIDPKSSNHDVATKPAAITTSILEHLNKLS